MRLCIPNAARTDESTQPNDTFYQSTLKFLLSTMIYILELNQAFYLTIVGISRCQFILRSIQNYKRDAFSSIRKLIYEKGFVDVKFLPC